MRSFCLLTFLFCFPGSDLAEQNGPPPPTVKVRSNLVLVPVLVKTKSGEVQFDLEARDFLLTDNGVEQRPALEQETDSEPLALAVVVETGGAGADHLADYQRLDSILDALIGNLEHRVALIGFDSTPHRIVPFTEDTGEAARALAALSGGDRGAAILDGVALAVAGLREEPAHYRRAILLFSETIDQGSKTTLEEALRLVGETNTAIYSFAFSSTRAAASREASKLESKEPGPEHGCFSRAGADPEFEGHYSRQVLDCLSQLAPPLRLATLTFHTARNILRTNTAESLARFTGGELFHFAGAKELKAGLVELSNDLPSYCVLSFQPESPAPGLHLLRVAARGRPKQVAAYRHHYWASDAVR